MATTEETIAGLVAIGGQNLSLPQQIAATATTQIQAMGGTYQNMIASQTTQFWVDQVAGLDTAAGTLAAPFKTVQKALSLTPRGGFCTVRLKSDYSIDAEIIVDGKVLVIKSATGGRPNLYFGRYIDLTVTPNLRSQYAFSVRGLGHVSLQDISVNVPVLDGGYAAIAPYYRGLFNTEFDWAPVSVSLANCNLVIPAAPYTYLFQSTVLVDLIASSLTLTGAVTSILGRSSADQPNTAGVASNTLSWLRTNLASI